MFIKNIIYGLLLGIAFIIPGISGGVVATILGIYDELIYKLNSFFSDFKNNLIYISSLSIGIITSILLFSKIILYLFNNHYLFISYLFIGLILGTISGIIKEINNKTNKKINMYWLLISIVIGIMLFCVQNSFISNNGNINTIIMIIAGFLYACGKIIPGISGASLLMILGIYEYLLKIISNPLLIFKNINTLLPFIISLIISAIALIKIMNYLLKRHFNSTYSFILGFVICSILFIYPNYFSWIYLFVSIPGILISYYLCK